MRASVRMMMLPLLLALAAAPAAAEQPKCPLDLVTCLGRFQLMKERPWMGAGVDRDSLGVYRIVTVTEGAPGEKAGLLPGDVLQKVGGKPPGEWFAGKAGWKMGDHGQILVSRNGHERALQMEYRAIPEDVFAKIVGIHMVEAHMAYMHAPASENVGER